MDLLKDLLQTNSRVVSEADEEDEWPKTISKAGGYTVEIDENEQVYFKAKGDRVLAKMPYVIWTQLTRG
jgi:hypothetical protein